MKITVVGAHGTGKTTLAKKLAERLSLTYIPDVVPEAFSKKFLINENTPPETQFWILSKQLELERNTPLPWIADKSLFDNIVYGGFSIYDTEVRNVIRKIVFDHPSYDLIFYLPIEFSLNGDENRVLRSLNTDFQKAIDISYKKLLIDHEIPFIELTGSVDNRVKTALDQISAYKRRNG